MARLDPKESFDALKQNVQDSIKDSFPQVGDKHTLEVEGVEIADNQSSADYTSQKKAKMGGRTWGVPVHAMMILKDTKTGKVIERKRQKVATLPKVTNRYSYIVDGSEFQVDNQWRLKPGVYTKVKENGELDSFFNIKGRPLHVGFDPKTRRFQATHGGAKPPMYPIMKAMGVSDDTLEETWGKEILEANKIDSRGRPVKIEKVAIDFAKRLDPRAEVENYEQAAALIQENFKNSKLSPDVTKRTLGKSIDHINSEALVRSSGRLLGISRGTEKPDVRDSLMFKDFHGVEDFVGERITGHKQVIDRRIGNNLDRRDTIKEIVSPDTFNRPIKEFFGKVSLANTPTQTNPLKMISGQMRTTIAGEGGVADANRITEEAKLVDPSHFAVLDPLNTPECHCKCTEVFTKRGWVSWPDVRDDDLFACRVDGRLEFHQADRVVREHYVGTMYGVETAFFSYCVTPNHRMWCHTRDPRSPRLYQWHFETAEGMHENTRNVTTVHEPYESFGDETFGLPYVQGNNSSKNVDQIDFVAWAELLGWYLAEGSFAYKEETSCYRTKISKVQKANPQDYAEIEALLPQLPFRWGRYARGFLNSTKQLAHYVKQFGHAPDKFVPKEFFEQSTIVREALLSSLLRGDGRLNARRTNGDLLHDRDTFTTTSVQLAEDVEWLIISLGYAATHRVYEDKREERYHAVHEVRILRRRERVARKGRDFYTIAYDDLVYCATVPGGLLYTRRNGKTPFWSGNSGATGVSLQLALGARKKGKQIVIPLINVKTGKREFVDTTTVHDSVVALPDAVQRVGGKYVPKKGTKVLASTLGNEMRPVKMQDIQYVVPKSSQMFSLATNMVPFLNSNSPNRATMAGRHMEQAIPLKDGEAPLVQATLAGKSFDERIGGFASHHAPVEGKIVRVGKDSMTIQGASRKQTEVPLYNNYPLNDKKGFMDSRPVVKKGDTVKKGQLIADTNYSKNGVYAPGKNLRIGYLPWAGKNFEDGVVISETASKKLTSEHMYKKGLSTRDASLDGKKKYRAYYPDRMNKEQFEKLDDAGIVQVGQKVKPGDTLIAALADQQLTTEQQKLRMLHKSLVKPKKDKAIAWEEDFEGEVVEVNRQGKSVEVHVKTLEPMEIGDKLVGRVGNKGICTSILPDHEMPQTKSGKPMEVLMNPIGIAGRMNIGQVLETAASKVARKTGKPFLIENFEHDDNLAHVQNELKKVGISDKEDLVDPNTGKIIPGIQTGHQYILKMEHQVGKKMSARDRDAYDHNLVPRGGGKHGAQALGSLGVYAMLSHGAHENLREMAVLKSDKAQGGEKDELWGALQAGEVLPPPKTTFAYKKFNGYLNGMGVDVKKDGNSLNLVPLTDAQVKDMSEGELKDPGRILKMRTLKPEKGGLFDEKITGGLDGKKFSHIKLSEPMPNPLFEKAAMNLTGIRGPQFARLIDGEDGVDKDGKIVPGAGAKGATYGPKAVGVMLDQVNVDKDLVGEEKRIKGLKGQAQSESRRKIKYLRNLKKLKMSPRDAYMMQNVPVLPPSMRPISIMEDGSLQTDDLNELYKGLGIVNKKMGEFPKGTPESMKAPIAASTYDHLKALTGIGGTLNKKHPGILDTLAGKDSPKSGFVQAVLIKRKQDMTARSTIVPEPSLSLDEAAIPRKAAKEMYKVHVVRELGRMSSATPLQARKMIEEDDPLARKALERVVGERPLLLKRDPVLHKYGIQAFKAKLTEGKAIKIHPLVCSGYGADFNGDSCKSTESLMIRFEGELKLTTFGELASMLLPSSTEADQLALAADGTAVLELGEGLDVLSWIPDVGVRWSPASEFTIHTSHGEAYEVTTHIGRKVTVSEHHNFGTVGQKLVWGKVKTDEIAKGMLIPFVRKMPLPDFEDSRVELSGGLSLPNDFKGGWLCGYFVGDGGVTDQDDTISLTCGNDCLHPLLTSIFAHVGLSSWDAPGRGVRSTHKRWADSFKSVFGCKTSNKKVPDFVFMASENFRAGFVSGLVDAAGSIQEDKNGTAHVSIEVTSSTLVDGMCWLLGSFGIGAYRRYDKAAISETKKAYVLEVSREDLEFLPSPLFEDKAALLCRLLDQDQSGTQSRYDLVPFSSEVANLFIQRGKRDGLDDDLSERNYKVKEIQRYGELGYITRKAAERIIHRYGCLDNPAFKRWRRFVDDGSTSWTLVTSIEEVERPKIMYDFSVPKGNETFAVAGGLITRNTMSAFVPISQKAIKEAEGMYPSKNLFSPSTHGVMYTPSHEQQVGLFMATQTGKVTKHSFANQAALEKAFNAGTVKLTDVVKVGNTKTTLGRVRVNKTLPKAMQGGPILKDLKFQLTKKEQGSLFQQAARMDPKAYPEMANSMKDLGNDTASTEGFSFGLEDFKVHKDVRDPILRAAAARVAKLDANKPADAQKIVDVYGAAMEKIEVGVKSKAKQQKTQLDRLEIAAGIKGNGYRQLTAAPVLFVDGKGDVVPNPVTKSYSEGLDTTSYWSATSGGRKGIIQKVQSVREPGYLTKMMTNSVIETMVDADDCGTDRGINLSIDEPDVVGRFTTADVNLGRGKKIPAGTMLTPDIVTKIKNNKTTAKVVVRSPMRCIQGKGVCKTCLGLDETGNLPDKGTNVGVMAAQALGERGTQLALKSFHSGGVYEGKDAKSLSSGGLERAVDLLYLKQKVKGSATLATSGGKIRHIKKDPAGGYRVKIGDTEDYIPADRARLSRVRVGQSIRKGDALTKGPINPHELLPLVGMSRTQGHLAGELHSIYGQHGIRRRNSEVMVRALSGVTKVEDPGGNTDLLPGDFTSTTQVYDWNKKNKGTAPVTHSPVLRGVKQIPLDVQEDWMARLNHEHLRSTIIEASQRGWSSDLHGLNPVPPLVHGIEFGKGTKEKPWRY